MTLRRLILLATAAATIVVFLAVDSRSHSVSDTFYGMIVPEMAVLLTTAALLVAVRVMARGRP